MASPLTPAGGSGASSSAIDKTLMDCGFRSREDVYQAATRLFADESFFTNPEVYAAKMTEVLPLPKGSSSEAIQRATSQFFQTALQVSQTKPTETASFAANVDKLFYLHPEIGLTIKVPLNPKSEAYKKAIVASKLLSLLTERKEAAAGAGADATEDLPLPLYCTIDLYGAYINCHQDPPVFPSDPTTRCRLLKLCVYLQDEATLLALRESLQQEIRKPDPIEKRLDLFKTMLETFEGSEEEKELIEDALNHLLSEDIRATDPKLETFRSALETRGLLPLLAPLKISLDLSKLPITDLHLEAISTLFPCLQKLNLSDCFQITDAGLKHLKSMPLTHLNLTGCALITQAGLKPLESGSLTHLDLSGCRLITDAGLKHLKSMPLTHLELDYCRYITDAGLAHLESRPLTRLDLANCLHITDAGLEHLKNMPLTYLKCKNISRATIAALKARRPGILIR